MAQAKNLNKLEHAYAYCRHIAKTHYENFPVASICLPQHLRNSIAAIYAFARLADDYADDPKLSPTEKLQALNLLEKQIIVIPTTHSAIPAQSGIHDPNNLLLLALTDTIQNHDLPIQLFLDLLTAFKQDVTKNRYDDFGQVLTYCSYSANPIGRLLLHLSKQDSVENLEYSDFICTGLQLINFMQDLYLDLTNLDRCYIPQDDLSKFKVSIKALKAKQKSANIDALIADQLDKTDAIYSQGLALGSQLTGLFGLEIRLIIAGGKQILTALYATNKYYERPTLTFINKLQMLTLALFPNQLFQKTL